MSDWDDLLYDVRIAKIDDDTMDRLLAGHIDPDDAPPGYGEVARILQAVPSDFGPLAATGRALREKAEDLKALLDAGHRPDDHVQAAAAAKSLDPTRFDETALKSHAVGEAASFVSAIADVRAAVFKVQREFAAVPPGAMFIRRSSSCRGGSAACASAAAASALVSAR